jgi:hypothetical protein
MKPMKRTAAVICGVVLIALIAWGGRAYLNRDSAGTATSVRTAQAVNPSFESNSTEPATNTSDGGNDATLLPEDERKYVWDIEHVATQLDAYVFPRMAKALRDGDREAFAAYLSDSFSGRVPDPTKQSTISYPFAQFGSIGADDTAWRTVDGHDFVSFLFAGRDRFRERQLSDPLRAGHPRTGFLAYAPLAEIRLRRLAPVERRVINGPWRGTMHIRFSGELADQHVGEIVLEAAFEFDAPGDDIDKKLHWLKACRLTSLQSRDARHVLFREVASERGIDSHRFHDNWHSPDAPPRIVNGGFFVCDYDHDGRLDLLVTDVNGPTLFRAQTDGTFADETLIGGLSIDNRWTSAAFVDLDGDGFEDLLLGPQVFQNKRDGTFRNVSGLTNLRLPSAMSAYSVADYDLDGNMDVYVSRASPGPFGKSRASWINDQTGPGNQLWRNLGDWKFEEVTELLSASAGRRSSFASVWLDANSDGRPDLAVADEFGSSVLLVNGEYGFTESVLKKPFGGFCMGISAGDIDNDGAIDLYLANMASKAGDRVVSNLPSEVYPPEIWAKFQEFVTGNELLQNRGDLNFEWLGRKLGVTGPGWAYGPSLGDLNADGWLDIYAPGGFISHGRGEPDG